jgi:hypothetical protein
MPLPSWPLVMPSPNWPLVLSTFANLAQILTAVVAAGFGLSVLNRSRSRRLRLETYLAQVRKSDDPEARHGLRTALHLSAALSMTEAEVHEAAFGSSKIKVWPVADATGRADTVMFQFTGKWRPD